MDESPLVSPNIKEYISKHKLEDKMNEAINEVLRNLPDDPFSALVNVFKNNSSSNFVLNKINIYKTFYGDFKHYLTMEITMTYKGNTRKCLTWNLTYNSKIFDFVQNNLDFLMNIIEKNFRRSIQEIPIEQFSSFDKNLRSNYDDLAKVDNNSEALGKLLSNAISLGVFSSQSIIQELSIKDYVKNIFKEDISKYNSENIPNLAFTIFKCGKSMNSKVKFERFILIINNSSKMKKEELNALIVKIYGSVKKILTSGKQGELGMRLNAEGSYFTPNDTLNDTIKVLEDIIKDTGESTKLSIGIDCNANNYFNEGTKKYDMDGFKQPPDAEALIDYYLKYLSEHPLISFLEDPLADGDIQGWKKIFNKFESKQNVVISSKNLIDERVTKLNNLTQLADLEQIADYMTEDEKLKIQAQNKIKQDENENKVKFSNVSFRINECIILSELFESYQFIQNKLSTSEKKVGFYLWDNAVESDQNFVVDIALGLRAKMIILHGFNNRNERINKINRYIDLIEELY